MAGLGAVLTMFLLAAGPALSGIVLRVAGFEPIQATRPPPTAAPIPAVSGTVARSPLILAAAGLGQAELPASANYSVVTGVDAGGADVVHITIRAENVSAICQEHTDFCGDGGHPVRRAEIRLGNGGLVFGGEFFVEGLNIWQAIELRLSLRGAAVAQIDSLGIGGAAYGIPDNVWGQRIRELEAGLNQMLGGLSVQVGGRSYALVDVLISENQLVAAFR